MPLFEDVDEPPFLSESWVAIVFILWLNNAGKFYKTMPADYYKTAMKTGQFYVVVRAGIPSFFDENRSVIF